MTRTGRRTVLVTDGEQRAALAVVRSLGAAGHEVHVGAGARASLAGASRHARSHHVLPDALHDPERFQGAVHALVERLGADTLLPITEAALHALLPARERLPRVLLPFTDAATFDAISDKARVLDAARAAGIAVPAERRAHGPESTLALADELRYPLVLKPSRSVRVEGGTRSKHAVAHAADREALVRVLATLDRSAFPLLLQERIVGPGVGVFLLLWDDRVVARFAHQRLREKPPAGGVSTLAESVRMDEALYEHSVALLRAFGWRGVAMVEFKRDARTGTPYLMEINGRFWGSLQLAIDAGVDFPALLVAAAAGESPPAALEYRVGVRSRWWWGDVDHLLTRFRRSAAHLSLPADAPSRWDALRGFVSAGPPHRGSDVLRWDDPRPFLHETAHWLRQLVP